MRPFDGKRRLFNEKKFLGFLILVPLAILLFGFIVMSLWNSVLVAALHVSVINFWQALGILVLSKILFGGFRGPRRGRFGRGGMGDASFEKRREMFEKFQTMTPEERREFKQNWRSRCASWKNADDQTKPTTEETTM